MTDFRRSYTVWFFTSPSSAQTAKVVRVSEPNDIQTQHEYQRVLWRGLASTPAEALANA